MIYRSAVQAAVLPVVRDRIGMLLSKVVLVKAASAPDTITPDDKVTQLWVAAMMMLPVLPHTQ
jgi:hypothetical protein